MTLEASHRRTSTCPGLRRSTPTLYEFEQRQLHRDYDRVDDLEPHQVDFPSIPLCRAAAASLPRGRTRPLTAGRRRRPPHPVRTTSPCTTATRATTVGRSMSPSTRRRRAARPSRSSAGRATARSPSRSRSAAAPTAEPASTPASGRRRARVRDARRRDLRHVRRVRARHARRRRGHVGREPATATATATRSPTSSATSLRLCAVRPTRTSSTAVGPTVTDTPRRRRRAARATSTGTRRPTRSGSARPGRLVHAERDGNRRSTGDRAGRFPRRVGRGRLDRLDGRSRYGRALLLPGRLHVDGRRGRSRARKQVTATNGTGVTGSDTVAISADSDGADGPGDQPERGPVVHELASSR